MKLSARESILAKSYFHSVLEHGSSLCKMIKVSIDVEKGRFSVYAFRGALQKPLTSFSTGLGPNPSSVELVESKISEVTIGCGSCIYVVDDIMAGEQDIAASDTAVIIGDEVYHFLTGGQGVEQNIDDVISIASVSWHSLIAILCVKSKAEALYYLKAGLAPVEAIFGVVIGAFDGEGYLVWSKN